MLRRLLIAFLVLVVVAIVALDRVGVHVADHVLAGKLQSDEHLPHRPAVSIDGFPFLTQAIGGDYHDVSVTAHDFRTPEGVTVTTLKAHLRGAHIPLSKVLHGSVSEVPVDKVDGTAFLSFGEISRYLSGRGSGTVTLSRASAHGVELTGRLPLGARHPLVHTVVTVGVSSSVVTLSGPSTGPRAVRSLVLSIPLHGLPFQIDVTSVTVDSAGVTAAGVARHVKLGSHPATSTTTP
ncbi:MAG TPA: DUF2993 domain-containing protein [Mycobacteriales bacterium]|nr:DUF2993 domain-containing protein [Mycobacteriales bacterium]